MENKQKQTAVEWLVEKLDQNFDYVADTIIEQAKEMEKDQIIQAYTLGHVFHDSNDETAAEFYYKTEYENTNN